MNVAIDEDENMENTVECLGELGITIHDIYRIKRKKKATYEATVMRSEDRSTGRGETPAKALENAVNAIIKTKFN